MSTAQSLRKFFPDSSRFSSWSSFGFTARSEQLGKGHHVPLINITHNYGDEEGSIAAKRRGRQEEGENTVLFDSVGADDHAGNRRMKKDDFVVSSSDDEDDSDEEAQLEYERRRRERKGKSRAVEEV